MTTLTRVLVHSGVELVNKTLRVSTACICPPSSNCHYQLRRYFRVCPTFGDVSYGCAFGSAVQSIWLFLLSLGLRISYASVTNRLSLIDD